MAENIKELNADNFSKEIATGKWAVDFWAAWCGPCRMMAPHFEAAAKEMKEINFAKLDTEESPEVAQEYNIMGIPCILFFKDGKEVGRSVGLIGKDELIARASEAFE